MPTIAGMRPDVEFSRSSADLLLWAEVISHARCAGLLPAERAELRRRWPTREGMS
jgi:hypothetical protein